MPVLGGARNLDFRGVSMTDGVDDKLADDPDEGVKDVVWQISPWYIESDGELRSVQMLSHGLY